MNMNKRDLKTLKEKTLISSIDMNEKDLNRLSKLELIKLLLKQEAKKPSNSVNEHEEIIKSIPPPRTRKWESIKPKPVARLSPDLFRGPPQSSLKFVKMARKTGQELTVRALEKSIFCP